MKKIFNLLCFVAIMLSTILSSCYKEDSNTNTPTSNPLLGKSYSVYTGSSLNALELSETFEFQYNAQGKLTSKIQKYYENSISKMAHYFDYTYSGNTIIQNDYFEYNGNKSLLEISYLKLNARNIVISDSNVDATNPSNFRVRKYIYNTNNQLLYSYIGDTTNGSVFDWSNGNLTKEYLFNGLMGRFLIMTHIYGSKTNTLNTGNFWNDGEKSINLLEKSLEPNYEYNYTYKIESDGFISEKITAVSSPGGSPYRYEKTVFKR